MVLTYRTRTWNNIWLKCYFSMDFSWDIDVNWQRTKVKCWNCWRIRNIIFRNDFIRTYYLKACSVWWGLYKRMARDDQGRVIIEQLTVFPESHLVWQSELQISTPMAGSISNTLKYKNFIFSALVDSGWAELRRISEAISAGSVYRSTQL